VKISKILLASTMLCALSAPAFAAEVTNGDVYAKLSGGAIIPEDIDVNSGGVTGSVKFDTGWTVSGTLGFWLNDNLTVEGELGYLSADIDSIDVLGVSAATDGDFTSAFAFVNADYHFSGKNAGFDPYIGAGVGVARSEISIDSVLGVPVNQSDDSTDGALQASAGFDFDLGGGTKIGAQYRYLYVDTGGDDTDSFTGHNITAHVSFAF
jgi:OOP family OmpA-OmpF porin